MKASGEFKDNDGETWHYEFDGGQSPEVSVELCGTERKILIPIDVIGKLNHSLFIAATRRLPHSVSVV